MPSGAKHASAEDASAGSTIRRLARILVAAFAIALAGWPAAAARCEELARIRLVVGGGIVNGYQYLPPTQLQTVGITVRHGFGQEPIVYGQLLRALDAKDWIGLAVARANFRRPS